METLPDIEDDVTPGLSILYPASDYETLSPSRIKLEEMHELYPKLMLSVTDEVKDQENIRYTETCLDEVKG